ncbi:hypothetical protein NGI46_05825 [Peribacillus butanolivorans]|nr:hypothetical protein [Peribacillus butanolivorans]MCO0596981.1 hypothetical protein [Peribacillus butanolivorans]
MNDKNTGEKAEIIDDLDGGLFGSSENDVEGNFGPVSTDGSIKVHGEVEYPWGIAKSVSQTIDEDTKSLDITPIHLENKKLRIRL